MNSPTFLRSLRRYGFIIILCVSLLPLLAQEHYLADGQPDVAALLPPPPLPGSPEQAADMQEVRMVSRNAPSNDVAVAFTEKEFSIFNFTPAIGDFFQPGKFPKTEVFFERVQKQAESVTDQAKDYYKRPRPYDFDARVQPCVKKSKSFSYPSGHATSGTAQAVILANMVPEKKDAILARGMGYSENRVVGGVHYQSDIVSGEKAGVLLASELLRDEAFKADYEKAKAELRGVLGLK